VAVQGADSNPRVVSDRGQWHPVAGASNRDRGSVEQAFAVGGRVAAERAGGYH
jgi:hypothetical protein